VQDRTIWPVIVSRRFSYRLELQLRR